MLTQVLSVVFGCKHEFGFPITLRGAGRACQVCVRCGAEYEYDWKNMKRLGQIEPKSPPAALKPLSAKAA